MSGEIGNAMSAIFTKYSIDSEISELEKFVKGNYSGLYAKTNEEWVLQMKIGDT